MVKSKMLNKVSQLKEYIGDKKILLVCDNAFDLLPIKDEILHLTPNIIRFSDFVANPAYESIVSGVKTLKKNKCDVVLAIGGGSTIDVAKCIKLFATMEEDENYLQQKYFINNILLIVIPTTAGTGSEATHFAVIYFNGEKQSVAHDSLIPQYVLLLPELLKSLPDYQRKVTMLDALCHAIEAWWSVNSTQKSKEYSKKAIRILIDNIDSYSQNDDVGNENMQIAANFAGKSINITQTTAAHAMSYKLSSILKIAHGHAAFLVLPILWEHMILNKRNCVDIRGQNYLLQTFNDIAAALGEETPEKAVLFLKQLYTRLELENLLHCSEKELTVLTTSVNVDRLKNNPVELDFNAIKEIYTKILKEEDINE